MVTPNWLVGGIPHFHWVNFAMVKPRLEPMVIRASVSFSGISAKAVLEELEELAAARLVLPRKLWSQVGASINLVLWLVYI